MLESFFPGVQHLQNIHPLVVHFPIAFLNGAVLLYFLALILRSERLSFSAFVLLILGTLSLGAAAGTGLYAEEGVMVSRSVRANLLDLHERLMLTALGFSVLLSLWGVIRRPFPKKGRSLFLILLVGLLIVIAKGADYGGRMVYDYNAGGSACGQPIEFEK